MYVIAGVTGHTGTVVAERLLAKGQAIRVIVREAHKGARWHARGAEIAVASLDDDEAIARALTGARGTGRSARPTWLSGASNSSG